MNSSFISEPSAQTSPLVKRSGPAFLLGLSVAGAGIVRTIQTQRNMKIHLLCALAVALFCLIFPLALSTQALLFLCIALVLAAELLNTALEAIVDLCSPDFHTLAKTAKDAAAGAVLVLSVAAALIFVAVAWPLIQDSTSMLATFKVSGLSALNILISTVCLLFYRAKNARMINSLCVVSAALSLWPLAQSSANYTTAALATGLICLAWWSARTSTH